MADYQAPLQQMRFTIEHLAGFDEVKALPDYETVDSDTVEAVLEEAARFASGVLAPINWLGDRQGVRVLRDPYSAKPYVLFYTTKRVGGGVQNFEAIKLMKFGVS